MYAKLLSLLLLACQIILNQSSVIRVEEPVGSAAPEIQTPVLPEGYRSFPDVHAAYKIHEVESTWYEARDRCIAEGARLAITDSREKVAHINSMKTPSTKWLHVGIHQVDGQWVRVDNNLPSSSVPWVRDNPDGTGNCAGISISGENGLVDYQCEWGGEYYVCEIPL